MMPRRDLEHAIHARRYIAIIQKNRLNRKFLFHQKSLLKVFDMACAPLSDFESYPM